MNTVRNSMHALQTFASGLQGHLHAVFTTVEEQHDLPRTKVVHLLLSILKSGRDGAKLR
ncbi:hypothetical protein G3M48_009924, partial [Beauveria asiatica]